MPRCPPRQPRGRASFCFFKGAALPIGSIYLLSFRLADRPARNPFNSQPLISHLTHSNGCGNLQPKVADSVPVWPPNSRVYSRNQPFLPPPAPRNANIPTTMSTLRILPVTTGVCPLFASSRHSSLATRRCPLIFSNLRTLFRSLRSFSGSHRLFSIACGLFLQNTRGGIPLRELLRCTEAQKGLSVSPFLATLTQTPGMGVPPLLLISSDFNSPLVYPERSSRRSLPFAHAGQFPPQASSVQPPETPRLCGPILFAQPLVSSLWSPASSLQNRTPK